MCLHLQLVIVLCIFYIRWDGQHLEFISTLYNTLLNGWTDGICTFNISMYNCNWMYIVQDIPLWLSKYNIHSKLFDHCTPMSLHSYLHCVYHCRVYTSGWNISEYTAPWNNDQNDVRHAVSLEDSKMHCYGKFVLDSTVLTCKGMT